jgi:hypothetical protein
MTPGVTYNSSRSVSDFIKPLFPHLYTPGKCLSIAHRFKARFYRHLWSVPGKHFRPSLVREPLLKEKARYNLRPCDN